MCSACADKLRRINAIEAIADDEVTVSFDPSALFYINDGTYFSCARQAADALRSSLVDLTMLLSTHADRRHDTPLWGKHNHYGGDKARKFKRSVLKSLQLVESRLSASHAESAQIGRDMGESFICRLASGDVSYKELSKGGAK